MRKFMFWFICISLFFGKTAMVKAEGDKAEEKEKYYVKIRVYDTDNKRLSLEDAKFHIEAGDITVNYDDESGVKHGYGYGDKLDLEMGFEYIRISSIEEKDIFIIISGDYGKYQFFIEETIPLGKLMKNETIYMNYNLSDLKKITLNTNQNEKTDSLKYYICRTDTEKAAASDEIAGGWAEIKDVKDKNVYVNKGIYSLTFSSQYKNVHKIFVKERFLVLDNVDIDVSTNNKEFDYKSVEISDIYDEYTYYGIKYRMSNGTAVEDWTERRKADKVELYVDKDMSVNYVRMYLSNEIDDIYNKSVGFSLNGEMKLGDKYYYDSVSASKHKGGKYGTRVSAVDNKNVSLSFININRVDDVYIEVYNKETGELVFEDGFSSYWDYLEFDFDMSEDYTAKIFSKMDSNVNGAAYYDLTFTSTGKPIYKFDKVVYDK